MKNKLISIATSIAMLFGGFGMATTPVNVNATVDNGFTSEEISKSPLKPTITVDLLTLSYEDARRYTEMGTPIEVNFTLSGGMDKKYSTTGTHVDFDNRLSYPVKKDGSPDIKIGKAFEQLDLISVGEYVTKYGDSRFSIMTNSSSDNGYDGTMYTLQFYLPEDVQPGDFYPVDIVYMDGDMFTDIADSKEAQLAQAYLFTWGIDNGGISIEGSAVTTTATTKTTTPIITTTSTATAPATTTTETVVTYGVNGVDISIESVPTKTVYNAGEKLDLTGGVYKLDWLFGPFSGGTAFRQTQETRSMTSVGRDVEIDTSEFDNTRAGTYKIYITGYFGGKSGHSDTESFEVEVLPETTTTTAMTTEAPEVTTTETLVTYAVNGVDISIESVPTKTVYNIGEKLDLTGGVYKYDWLFGPFTGGTAFKQTQETCSMTSIGRDVTIDTSEFDNTKAGTYKIYITANLSFNEFSDTEYFEVTVKNPLESESGVTLPYGDADCDGKVSINDAVLVMQSIANPDKYKLTNIGKMTADVVDKGNGITNADALAIQYVESKTIKESDLPMTSEELEKLNQ
ncbi:MAG: hypothetical protein K2I06_04485 [Ruminococcus sp.]|nr:hypothetical protein [Ruminococcus sp.]